MFVFGHVGLTWGGALLLARLSHWWSGWRPRACGAVRRRRTTGERLSAATIDYRAVILGSMLPDLIDKPLGIFILGDELHNGRFLGHSLLFVVLLLLAALAFRRSAGPVLSAVALGSAAHLVLDRMWVETDTLLWPLLGWTPEKEDVSGWLEQMLEQLFSDPYIYLSEAAGALVVAAILASLLAGRSLREFALTGRMGWHPVGLPVFGLAAGKKRPQQLKRGEGAAQR
jgi:inner membrane protein